MPSPGDDGWGNGGPSITASRLLLHPAAAPATLEQVLRHVPGTGKGMLFPLRSVSRGAEAVGRGSSNPPDHS